MKGEKKKTNTKTTALIVILFASAVLIALPIKPAQASVYNYAITDVTQTAPDTIIVTARCRFCSACNPNHPGWPDRGDGCIPFACGYPPPSFPSYASCQRGRPDGRFAAVRISGSFGSRTQKLVCDQSNWPLNTLWSHNFVFSGLSLESGETITVEADFYCSYCRHWYAAPQTFVTQMYTFVFIPFHWDADANVAKPSIASRSRWDCPDGQSSPRWTPGYSSVTHIMIHHTATTNNAGDWAKEVYNIWEDHANTKGWGDIGYNYLIDPDGVIYEGRAGGNDVIAAHAAVVSGESVKRLLGHSANPLPATDETNYNDGSMGIAFLGTFSGVNPSPAALRSAAALIAWKCAQRNIDPLGSGPDNDGIEYLYISGHRDVEYTACPGDKLHSLLGTLRQSVSNPMTQLLGSNTPDFETGFFAEVEKQKKLVIDNVGVLTNTNTEVNFVEENLLFPDHRFWNWLRLPPGWETIQFSETDYDQAKRYMEIHGWSYMVTFASNHGVIDGDRYIAITNRDMWNTAARDVDGFTNFWSATVLAESSIVSADYTVLHELGHTWGLCDEYRYTTWYGQASRILTAPHYCYDDYAVWLLTGHPPNSYPGDDTVGSGWSEGWHFDSKRCIMGPANPWGSGRGFCPAHPWDDDRRSELGAPRAYEGCAAHVDEYIISSSSVTSTGLASAIITFYKDPLIQPEVQEITGLSVVGKPFRYLGPADYSIQVLSEEGDQIYDSNITVQFETLLSEHMPASEQELTTDIVTVHWLAPLYSETTATVVIKDNVADQIVSSQIVEVPPITEAWIDYKTTDKNSYNFGETIEVTTEVNTTHSSMSVVLDVTLLDPNGIAKDYESWTGTIYPMADPVTLYLNIPSSGTVGTWTVYVGVLNSTGQLQDSKSNLITIGGDTTAPVTTLTVGSPQYTDGLGNIYVTSATSLTVDATDDGGTGSGVALTGYKVYDTSYDSGWITGSPPISFQIGGLDDGLYYIDYNSTDNAGNVESTNTKSTILDNTCPLITVSNPPAGWALMDGVTFMGSITDSGSGVCSMSFSIREENGDEGIPIGFEDLPISHDPTTGDWSFSFDTLLIPDGYYVLYIEAEDNLGNGASTAVPYSVRNWAVIELLPSSKNNKAGRTMPVKFALRVVAEVDPDQPFVYNEELRIEIFATDEPDNVLQESYYGDTARDYRISSVLYITNFKTLKTPMEYTVAIYRDTFDVGSFTFETTK